MTRIQEFVSSKDIATYWTVQGQYRQPYLGELKFPKKQKLGLNLSWVKGAKGAPVRLMPSTFDAKVIPISRKGFERLEAEMPYFKNSKIINERDRQDLLMVMDSGNQQAIDMIVTNIYDDRGELLESARLNEEAMRMQALTTGVISINDNGVKHTFDYGVPEEHKVSPTVAWDTTSADPVTDINAWADMIANEKGVRPTQMLLNSTTLAYLGKIDAIKNAVYVFGQGKVTVTRSAVIRHLEDETQMSVLVYDKGYDNDGTFVKFISDGTVILMPEENLGNTWAGTTPEETSLKNKADVDVTIVDNGIAITSYMETDPVVEATKVSEIVLPSFELADRVIIASVKTAG